MHVARGRRISRIRQLKQGAVEVAKSGVTASLVGVANYVSQTVYDSANL